MITRKNHLCGMAVQAYLVGTIILRERAYIEASLLRLDRKNQVI
jgi:hypothetical protein